MSGRKRLPDKQPTTRKAVEIHRRQEQAGSREKWQHQTRMSRERNVKAEKVSKADAANGRASQAARRRSYRLSLFFVGFAPPQNFRHPACPGSTCTVSVLSCRGGGDVKCLKPK